MSDGIWGGGYFLSFKGQSYRISAQAFLQKITDESSKISIFLKRVKRSGNGEVRKMPQYLQLSERRQQCTTVRFTFVVFPADPKLHSIPIKLQKEL